MMTNEKLWRLVLALAAIALFFVILHVSKAALFTASWPFVLVVLFVVVLVFALR